jgi:tRNA threonylcarbamoyladenosine biosynthesis protein TsaB
VNVLGIDTATATISVGVLRSDGGAFESLPEPSEQSRRPGHARELLPAVAAQMRASGLGFAELDSVAVGVGPGGYTGLRIGVATARALAQAHALPVRPVGSLAALAAGVEATAALPVLDARRGEVFAALYVAGEEVWPAFVTSPEALAGGIVSLDRAGWPTPLAAGDGAVRFRDILEAASVEVAPDRSPLHVVRALHVCRLAANVTAVPPEAVLPRYLRAPDATPTPR